MVFTSIVRLTGRGRVPMIKFRKGNPEAAAQQTQQAGGKGSANQGSTNAIEDWELPPRYWRKPIDQAEMAYINNGGAV